VEQKGSGVAVLAAIVPSPLSRPVIRPAPSRARMRYIVERAGYDSKANHEFARDEHGVISHIHLSAAALGGTRRGDGRPDSVNGLWEVEPMEDAICCLLVARDVAVVANPLKSRVVTRPCECDVIRKRLLPSLENLRRPVAFFPVRTCGMAGP
jgi:hypothetical protein